MQFEGRNLNKKETKNMVEFLNLRFSSVIDDLDYHTDAYGNVVLTNQKDLEKVLKVI